MCFYTLDPYIFTCTNSKRLAAPRVADDIILLILHGPLPIRSGHFLTSVKDAQPVFLRTHIATLLHLLMYQHIQFASRLVVR
jgi:hypothetical protein